MTADGAPPPDSDPTPGYVVRPYQSGDEEAILRLFNRVFSADNERFEERSMEAWRWEYRDNPAGTQVAVAITPEQEVIAHYACMPARVNVRGQEALAGQGVDSMVHPDWRRGLKKRGPFLSVAEQYFSSWGHAGVCHFGFGFPNQRAFRIGVKMLGYVPLVKPVPTLYRNFFEHADDEAVGVGGDEGLVLEPIQRFGPEFDTLWEALRPEYPLALVRDARYLQWRYLDPPHLRYRCWALRRDGALRGWLVTRAGWQGLPILALVDFLAHPEDEAAVGTALRQAVRDAREQEQVRVEVWWPEHSAAFRSALRQGFATEECNYVLCIMPYREEPSLDWIRSNWYYTIGDSDVF